MGLEGSFRGCGRGKLGGCAAYNAGVRRLGPRQRPEARPDCADRQRVITGQRNKRGCWACSYEAAQLLGGSGEG